MKESIKKEVIALIAEFHKQEAGNKITLFNINGLIMAIVNAIDSIKNYEQPET